MKTLAVISSHPIQYNAPLFRLLAQRSQIKVKVYYTWGESVLQNKYDPGFGKTIEWDIPLLEGYPYQFVENTAKEPGSHHFAGIKNPGLIELLMADQPAAILVFGWSFDSHLKVIRHFHGKLPVLFRGDSTLLDEQPGFSLGKLLRRASLRWIYRHIDAALYVGSANRRYFEAVGLSANRLFFVPHAIDNSRFAPTNVSPATRESRMTQGTRFLFCGKLEPKKAPDDLLQAFIQLDDPQASLLIVGNGVLEESLKQKAAHLPTQLRQRIEFMPFQNQRNMPAVYQQGDVFVLPSRGPGETWGLAVNEAMASARPVIVSNKCGCAEDLVKPGENGFVFDTEAPDGLLNTMKKMLDMAGQQQAMGLRSRQIIESWSYEAVAAAIEKTVAQLSSK